MVANELRDSSQASQFLKYTGNGPGPDFIGLGKYTGMRFDITTPLQVQSHLNRSYGTNLNIITYERPSYIFDGIKR